VVRTAMEPASIVPAIRSYLVHRQEQPVTRVQTLEDIVAPVVCAVAKTLCSESFALSRCCSLRSDLRCFLCGDSADQRNRLCHGVGRDIRQHTIPQQTGLSVDARRALYWCDPASSRCLMTTLFYGSAPTTSHCCDRVLILLAVERLRLVPRIARRASIQ